MCDKCTSNVIKFLMENRYEYIINRYAFMCIKHNVGFTLVKRKVLNESHL